MISRLPRWVWLGGCLLSLIGGMVNAVGFLGLTHQAISHLTGTTTLSAIALVDWDIPALLHLLAVILSYFAGAVLSGYIIQQSVLQLGQRYGVVLFLEALLLFAAVPLLMRGIRQGDYLASLACGLQNAMASSYSGAVVRTTHVSGLITDLGILTGHFLRGLPCDFKRMRLCSVLLFGFFGGGVLGALLFARVSYQTLYFPAMLTGTVGLAYTTRRFWKKWWAV